MPCNWIAVTGRQFSIGFRGRLHLKSNSTEITQLLPELCISSRKLRNNENLQITQETTEVISLFQTCKFQYGNQSSTALTAVLLKLSDVADR